MDTFKLPGPNLVRSHTPRVALPKPVSSHTAPILDRVELNTGGSDNANASLLALRRQAVKAGKTPTCLGLASGGQPQVKTTVTPPAPAPAGSAPVASGNFLQQAIDGVGGGVGKGFRYLGDGAGNAVGGLLSLPGDNFVARTAKSVVRGVGEFGADTVEGITGLVAHPVQAATGVAKLTTTAVALHPQYGSPFMMAEAKLTGRSYADVLIEKQNTAIGMVEGVKADFQQTTDRIGLPGAITKTVLDVVGLPKAGATVAVKAATLAGKAADLGKAARVADKAADLGKAAHVADKAADLGKAAHVADKGRDVAKAATAADKTSDASKVAAAGRRIRPWEVKTAAEVAADSAPLSPTALAQGKAVLDAANSGTLFHATNSDALTGMARTGKLMPASELSKNGIVRTTGEATTNLASQARNFISFGTGKDGLGSVLAYNDASVKPPFSFASMPAAELSQRADDLRALIKDPKLQDYIPGYDGILKNQLGQVEKEVARRAAHPGAKPPYPTILGFDQKDLNLLRTSDVAGERRVLESVDLKSRLKWASAPADRLPELKAQLDQMLGPNHGVTLVPSEAIYRQVEGAGIDMQMAYRSYDRTAQAEATLKEARAFVKGTK